MLPLKSCRLRRSIIKSSLNIQGINIERAKKLREYSCTCLFSICIYVSQFYITASLSVVATGAMMGWTSPVLPYLEKDGGPLESPISSEQSSWIGSLMALSAIFGSFVAGYLGEKYYL